MGLIAIEFWAMHFGKWKHMLIYVVALKRSDSLQKMLWGCGQINFLISPGILQTGCLLLQLS